MYGNKLATENQRAQIIYVTEIKEQFVLMEIFSVRVGCFFIAMQTEEVKELEE